MRVLSGLPRACLAEEELKRLLSAPPAERARTLVVVPTPRARRSVERACAGVCPSVKTFPEAFELASRLAGDTRPLLPASWQEGLLADCLRRAGLPSGTGAVGTVRGLIERAKDSRLSPDDLARGRATSGLRRAAEVFARYEEEKEKAGLVDSKDFVAADARGLRRRFSRILALGFYDLTRSEVELLRSARADVSLDLDDRERAFAPSQKTARALGGAKGRRPEPGGRHVGLARALFGGPRRGRETAVRLMDAADRVREVELVAEDILARAEDGTPLHEFCLVAPSAQEYGELVEEIFQTSGLTARVSSVRPLWRTSAGRAVLALLEAADAGFPFELVKRALLDPLLERGRFGKELREATKGRRMPFGLDEWAGALPEGGARELLRALGGLKERNPRWRICSEAMEAMKLSGLSRAPERGSTLDERARLGRELEELLRVLDELRSYPFEPTTDLPGFLNDVRRAFSSAGVAEPGWDESGVQFAGLREVRGTSFRHVYLLGLIEGEFPRAHRRNPFASEEEMERITGRSLNDLRSEERYDLVQLLCAAEESFTLSWPGRSGETPLVKSQFIEEIESAASLEQVPVRPSSKKSILVACGRALRKGDAEEAQALAGRSGRAQGVQRALERLSPVARVGRELVLRVLPGKKPVSVSAIQEHIECPLRFYARYVLGLERPEELDDDVFPDERGLLVHGVLGEFYQRRRGRPVTEDEFEEALKELEESARRAARGLARNERAVERLLARELGVGSLDGMLARFLREEIRSRAECTPYEFEVKFERLDFGGVLLNGRIDRVDRAEDGRLVVTDYKTGEFAGPGDVAGAKDVQLQVYARAAERMFQGKCVGASFYRVSRDEVKRSFALGVPAEAGKAFDVKGTRQVPNIADALALAEEEVSKAMDSTRSGVFSPPGDRKGCGRCRWKGFCRAEAAGEE